MFYTLEKSRLPSFEKLFARLVSTGRATSEQSLQLLQMYYALREFEKANALLELSSRNDSQGRTIKLTDMTSPSAARTGWVLQRNRGLARHDVKMKPGLHLVVVVSPGCHFAIKAVSEIESNSALAPLLRQKVTVMAMQDFNFDYDRYADWNQMHPLLPLVLTHSRDEWPEVSHWASPVFLFFRDGKLASTFSGWPAQGNRDKLYEGFGIPQSLRSRAERDVAVHAGTIPTPRAASQGERFAQRKR